MQVFQKYKELIRQVFSFGIVGVLNTLVDVGVFWALTQIKVLSGGGIATAIANALSYGCGMLCSFVLNRKFTFRDARPVTGKRVGLFIGVNLAAYAVSTGVILLAEQAGMPTMLAKLVSILFSLGVNFLGNKCFVFREEKPSE